MGWFKRLFGKAEPVSAPAPVPAAPIDAAEAEWREVADARAAWLEQWCGPVPRDMRKMLDLLALWPGGGLYVIPAPSLRPGVTVYTSFGLTNPDMPTTCTIDDLTTEHDGARLTGTSGTSGTMRPKEQQRPITNWPGYGYEVMVAAQGEGDWALALLQWAVKSEIVNDVDLRGRVERYDGLTIEQLQIGPEQFADVLIARAQAPLPATLDLPTGRAHVLVMTTITQDEMRWSQLHGRSALLAELLRAGVGQVSEPGRASVVPAPEFSRIRSREQAREALAAGLLYRVAMFPLELGGDDVDHNYLFVPEWAARRKEAVTLELQQAVAAGRIDNLSVQPQYKGDSMVPASIHVTASHSNGGDGMEWTIEVW